MSFSSTAVDSSCRNSGAEDTLYGEPFGFCICTVDGDMTILHYYRYVPIFFRTTCGTSCYRWLKPAAAAISKFHTYTLYSFSNKTSSSLKYNIILFILSSLRRRRRRRRRLILFKSWRNSELSGDRRRTVYGPLGAQFSYYYRRVDDFVAAYFYLYKTNTNTMPGTIQYTYYYYYYIYILL